MTDTTEEARPATAQAERFETFADSLRALVGKVVTVVNPESYEDAPAGRRLTTGFYRAKVADVGGDHMVLITEFQHRRGEVKKEPVKQYLPFSQVKRVSLMKAERVLHL